MVITYSPERMQWSFLCHFTGTIFPLLFKSPLFWGLLLSHAVLLAIDSYDDPLPPLDWKIAVLPNGLLTFFLVFYGNNCYTRYFGFYADVRPPPLPDLARACVCSPDRAARRACRAWRPSAAAWSGRCSPRRTSAPRRASCSGT